MLSDAIEAFREIFTQPFRATLIRVLLLTLALLAFVWAVLDTLITRQIVTPYGWLNTLVALLTGLGLVIGLVFLVPPVSSVVAGVYLDELAERVEFEKPVGDRVGRPMPAGHALWLATKFAGVSLIVNLAALALFLIPGVNALVFYLANSYLLGREYFELAALRFRSLEDVRALRRRRAVYLFLCGMFIAAFVSVPLLNLLTPLFGASFMVRVHQRMRLAELNARR